MSGPTLSFRGFDNSTYYILDRDPSRYANYSGTGNTLNTNHPIVRRMIVDSLRYWVEQMHVDGFRFDLAAILQRDDSGQLMPKPPVLWDIESDPTLAGTKLIAEAWDAAGLYQVGSFRRRQLERMERTISRRCAKFSSRGQRASSDTLLTAYSAAPRFTLTRNARWSKALTSSPATTDSR